jgi:dihydrodipicolinate synthase/N-acetylneuraminate lyase
MTPLTSATLAGSWGTLLLPIRPDDSVDFAAAEVLVDLLVAARVSGIYTNGTAGEFWTQTEAEFDEISHLVASKCEDAGLPFQLGASHPVPHVSLERVRRAARKQPGAIQVILPDWSTPSLAEAIAWMRRAADESGGIPLVLYNPPHAKALLEPEELRELAAAVPSLIGVKVAGGDEDWYHRLHASGADLSIFVAGHLLAYGMARGARGSYSNVACLSPAGAQRWYEQILADPAAGEAFGDRLLDFMRQHVLPLAAEYSNPALDKMLAVAGGWGPASLRLRFPYRSVPEDVARQVGVAARDAVPELFEA